MKKNHNGFNSTIFTYWSEHRSPVQHAHFFFRICGTVGCLFIVVFFLWNSRRSLPACGEFNNLLTWPGQILEVAANIAEPCKQIAVADEHLSNPKPEVVSSLSSDHTIPYQSLSSDQQGQKNWIGMLGRWHRRQFEYVWWWGNACVSTAPVYILQRCNPRQTTT